MISMSQSVQDQRLRDTLQRAGLVGSKQLTELVYDFKSKVLLRSGRDLVTIAGPEGTGRHLVAEAVHAAAATFLERPGKLVSYDCQGNSASVAEEIGACLEESHAGTLVIESMDALSPPQRRGVLRRLERTEHDTLLLALRNEDPATGPQRPEPTIRLKPVHEREDDIWELIEHFFTSAVLDAKSEPFASRCRGFSRQAKADLAQGITDQRLSSVRALRAGVRDIVFRVLARDEIPLKIVQMDVKEFLAERYAPIAESRGKADAALVGSRFDSLLDATLLNQLSELHAIPPDLLARQAKVVAEIMTYIDDVPASYRNVLNRAEDIQRAGLWLMSGARTQAEFRRFFGEERFMRPTKSVAWAFYNRVFKREM